ncbi:MAG: hypothetical protein PHV34_03900 [Verrucomicrobiae bacterium]|nr:hypothetical protein [Verrucomicrobiae bacterium]
MIDIEIYKCKRILQCEAKVSSSKDPLVLRIAVFQNVKKKKKFKFHLTRLDSYRIRPSFPLDKRGAITADERFFVEDIFLWPPKQQIRASSESVAINAVIRFVKNRIRSGMLSQCNVKRRPPLTGRKSRI